MSAPVGSRRITWLVAAAALIAIAILVVQRVREDEPATAARSPQAALHGRTSTPPVLVTPNTAPRVDTPNAPSSIAHAVAMPEGLAQDLAIFNSDQLRAELESIALSYPAVSIVSVACDGKPCMAELQVEHEDDDGDVIAALNTFLDLVSKRFSGYASATFREVTTPAGEPAVRVVLTIGGDAPRPPPQYGE